MQNAKTCAGFTFFIVHLSFRVLFFITLLERQVVREQWEQRLDEPASRPLGALPFPIRRPHRYGHTDERRVRAVVPDGIDNGVHLAPIFAGDDAVTALV